MSYADDAAGALADIKDAGSAVSFTRTVQVIDPTTEQPSAPSVTTVTGAALQVHGDPQQYERMKLTEKKPLTLLFAPDTYGTLPSLGSELAYQGDGYVVRSVDPVAPDGVAIIAKVVLST